MVTLDGIRSLLEDVIREELAIILADMREAIHEELTSFQIAHKRSSRKHHSDNPSLTDSKCSKEVGASGSFASSTQASTTTRVKSMKSMRSFLSNVSSASFASSLNRYEGIFDGISEEEADAQLFDEHVSTGYYSGAVLKARDLNERVRSSIFSAIPENRSHRASLASVASLGAGLFNRGPALDPVMPFGTAAGSTAASVAGSVAGSLAPSVVNSPYASQGQADDIQPPIPPITEHPEHQVQQVLGVNSLGTYGDKETHSKAYRQLRRLSYHYKKTGLTQLFEESASTKDFRSSFDYLRHLHLHLRWIVCSQEFDYAVGFLVLLNAFFVGHQVDWAASNHEDDIPSSFSIVNWTFCFLFVLELFARMSCNGWHFFFVSAEWKWNIFDTVMVVCQVAEEIVSLSVESSDVKSSNHAMVRVLRVLRLVRVVRFVRILRLIRELHTMVCSIIGSLRSFLWTVALLFGLIYGTGVLITGLAADHFRDGEQHSYESSQLRRYYGSLGSSILSLFQALSGGVDWEDHVVALYSICDSQAERVLYAMLYSAYIAFCMFVMLNLVTGIFVDSAQTNVREDRDFDLVNRVHALFMSADGNHTGAITLEEFRAQLGNPEMEEYFKTIDLDMSEADKLFELLDVHGEGAVSSDEFVNGCLRLRGTVKAYDIAVQNRWARRVFHRMITHMRRLETSVRLIAEVLQVEGVFAHSDEPGANANQDPLSKQVSEELKDPWRSAAIP